MFGTKRQRSHGHISAFIAAVVCAGAALLLFSNRQQVVDQLNVWQYQPNTEVASLVQRSGMNRNGEFYFYASRPAIEPAGKFNQECDRKEAGTAILGCYNGQYIYIYDVTNEKLDGIKEVTAAHEMLHATYIRLGDTEKKRVDALVEQEYGKLKNNSEFAARMAFYARTEPGERDNELHSVIGTEVANIDPRLEAHYKNYFTDRSKVVALHEKYAKVFEELKTRATTLSNQLTRLGDKIERESAEYRLRRTEVEAQIEDFRRRESGDGFGSRSQYESEVEELNTRISELNQFRDAINADIVQYNAIRDELITVSSQSQALNRSIDSSLAPAPSL